MTAPEPPPPDPGEPRQTEAQRRARVLAELEEALAEGTPAARDNNGWQYPPAPYTDAPPEPSLSPGALALLGTVLAVVVIAVVVTLP
jgi:hypothetical protein